jgi:hypothetical protein
VERCDAFGAVDVEYGQSGRLEVDAEVRAGLVLPPRTDQTLVRGGVLEAAAGHRCLAARLAREDWEAALGVPDRLVYERGVHAASFRP